MPYVDREDAGRHLAERLRHLRGADLVVLGLPRGGVPVAFEVAGELHAPLDVIRSSRNTASARSVRTTSGSWTTTWCGRPG
jgi:adenine/guanine phosphoribosyltransferase-like PRPP-binding protein